MQVNLNHQFKKNVEILSIGTELLLGNIVNTNSRWIAEKLSSLGPGTWELTEHNH